MSYDTVNQWRVWCTHDNKWVEKWDVDSPTQCPENISHDIDSTKTVIIDSVTNQYPTSQIGKKVSVHNSSKPTINGKTLLAQWVGCGDDIVNHVLGGGNLLSIQNTIGVPESSVDIKFDPIFGDVFIHEGYLSWSGASYGDYFTAFIIASPSQLQTVANKDLIVDGNGFVKFSPSGVGTGTHGFAAVPNLIPRDFDNDGDWDYTEETGLVPNMSSTGSYKISINEQIVECFIKKVPLHGTNTSFFRFVSEETFKLPNNYFIRMVCNNMSNSDWHVTGMITIYREKTI